MLFRSRFDIPWIRTRALYHGVQAFPSFKSIDTLQWARRLFMFNSNRLDYLGKHLGVGGKIKTEFGLWKDVVLHKCPKSLDRMVEYCKRDVEMLERIHHKLAQYAPVHTHAGVKAGHDRWTCPKCGSDKIKKNKTRIQDFMEAQAALDVK